MQIDVPLLKENNAKRILSIVRAFESYPLDRDAQRDAVLKLYNDKEEKSVFRGMVIPTLRKLGIIQGWEDMLILSGNGRLIAVAALDSDESGLRALRAVLLEEDRGKLNMLEGAIKEVDGIDALYSRLTPRVTAPSQEQAGERIERWITLLASAGLLVKKDRKVVINPDALNSAQSDLEVTSEKRQPFASHLFNTYSEIVAKQHGVDVVDISDLRGGISIRYWDSARLVVTEQQFDALLAATPFNSDTYIISFGKPMGPEEKLFSMNGNYYRTMSVRTLRGDDK